MPISDTRRKQAEKYLQDAEARFNEAIRQRAMNVTPTGQEILDNAFTPEDLEVLRRHFGDWDIYHNTRTAKSYIDQFREGHTSVPRPSLHLELQAIHGNLVIAKSDEDLEAVVNAVAGLQKKVEAYVNC